MAKRPKPTPLPLTGDLMTPSAGWSPTTFQLDLPPGIHPRGLWSTAIASSNGRVFYTACANVTANIASMCAYNLATREQWDTYHTLQTHGNVFPADMWSDGTTMWVADSRDNKIYAYKTASYFRDNSKEYDNLTGAGNTTPSRHMVKLLHHLGGGPYRR